MSLNENRGLRRGQDQCYYYHHGCCYYGDSCWFLHTPNRERDREVDRMILKEKKKKERQRLEAERVKNLKFEDRLKEIHELENNGNDYSKDGKIEKSISSYQKCLSLSSIFNVPLNHSQIDILNAITSRIFTQLSYLKIKSVIKGHRDTISHLSSLNLCQMSIWLNENNINAYTLKCYILYQLGLEKLANKCNEEIQQKFDQSNIKASISNVLFSITKTKSMIVPKNYFCKLCGLVNDHWIMMCPQRYYCLNETNRDKIQFYETLLSNLNSPIKLDYMFNTYQDKCFDAVFALFNLYNQSTFNLGQMVRKMVMMSSEYSNIRSSSLSVFLVLSFVKPTNDKFAKFAFNFIKYCNEYFNNYDYEFNKILFRFVNYPKQMHYYSPDEDNDFLGMTRNHSFFWLYSVGDNYWNQFIANIRKIHDSKYNHFLGFEIIKITPISKNKFNKYLCDHDTLANDEQLYYSKQKQKFNAWATNVWDVLKHYLFCCREIYELILFYCQRDEGKIFSVKLIGLKCYQAKGGIFNNMQVPIQFEKLGIECGDVIDIVQPGQYQDLLRYFVDIDEIDNTTLKLITMNHTTEDYDEYIDIDSTGIPLTISKKLCDPLKFYHFFSPFCGIDSQYEIYLPFTNYFIQAILGIYDVKNIDCHKYELYNQWIYAFCFVKAQIKKSHWVQNSFPIDCDGGLCISFQKEIACLKWDPRIIKSNKEQLPLIYFVESYYFKECHKLERKLKNANKTKTV